MKAALASGDRAMMYLLSRSARFRVGDPKVVTEEDADEEGIVEGVDGQAAAEVRDLAQELDRALRPHDGQAVANAHEELERARELSSYSRMRRQDYTSVLDLHFTNQYGHVPTSLRR
jgi:hypothetical protein